MTHLLPQKACRCPKEDRQPQDDGTFVCPYCGREFEADPHPVVLLSSPAFPLYSFSLWFETTEPAFVPVEVWSRGEVFDRCGGNSLAGILWRAPEPGVAVAPPIKVIAYPPTGLNATHHFSWS